MVALRKIFLLGIAILQTLAFSACQTEPDKAPEPPKIQEKRMMAPFRYHKAIEVKPGLTLDVVSWGRGSSSVGGYMVLRSDSTHLKYSSISGDLDGEIVDVWDMDMDADGDPELIIHARGEGIGSYLNLYIHEYGDNGSARKISFPLLSSASRKGYKGNDSVYVKEGKLMREFPVVLDNDTAKAAHSKRFEYSLRSNSFQVRELKAEN